VQLHHPLSGPGNTLIQVNGRKRYPSRRVARPRCQCLRGSSHARSFPEVVGRPGCPLWVISGHDGPFASCPLYLRYRPPTGDLFGKHLISEHSQEPFQGVQFQQLGLSLATTFSEHSIERLHVRLSLGFRPRTNSATWSCFVPKADIDPGLLEKGHGRRCLGQGIPAFEASNSAVRLMHRRRKGA
jgi:hypothetical protein